MQRKIKIIKLHFRDGSKTLAFGFHKIFKTYVDVGEILHHHPAGCLLMRQHKFLQTQLILNGVGSCRLIVFNEQGRFVAIKLHDTVGDAPISMFIPELFILVLPTGSGLLKESISSMEIVKSHKNEESNNKN